MQRQPYTVVGVYVSERAGAVFHVEARDGEEACEEAKRQARESGGEELSPVSAFKGHLQDESGDATEWD